MFPPFDNYELPCEECSKIYLLEETSKFTSVGGDIPRYLHVLCPDEGPCANQSALILNGIKLNMPNTPLLILTPFHPFLSSVNTTTIYPIPQAKTSAASSLFLPSHPSTNVSTKSCKLYQQNPSCTQPLTTSVATPVTWTGVVATS